jgi:hypothetical protein
MILSFTGSLAAGSPGFCQNTQACQCLFAAGQLHYCSCPAALRRRRWWGAKHKVYCSRFSLFFLFPHLLQKDSPGGADVAFFGQRASAEGQMDSSQCIMHMRNKIAGNPHDGAAHQLPAGPRPAGRTPKRKRE